MSLADRLQGAVCQLEGWAKDKHLLLTCYEMLHRASELVGSCEHSNKPSSSIKGGEFID